METSFVSNIFIKSGSERIFYDPHIFPHLLRSFNTLNLDEFRSIYYSKITIPRVRVINFISLHPVTN